MVGDGNSITWTHPAYLRKNQKKKKRLEDKKEMRGERKPRKDIK
jgi:hypothetical protein